MSNHHGSNGKEDLDKLDSRIIEDRLGNRRYTLNTIVDQIIEQFVAETQGRTDILGELDSTAKRLELVNEVADYVLATDYITLQPLERKWVIDQIMRDLFRFGPLEEYVKDHDVTEISINDIDEIFVRKGFGQSERTEIAFEHPSDISQLLERVLAPFDINIDDAGPFLEVGLKVFGRPIRLSMVGPPVMSGFNGQIRLHIPEARTLDTLQELVPDIAANMLTKIIENGHGLMIAGDISVGKTTILGGLLPFIAEGKSVKLVERAREIHDELIADTIELDTNILATFDDRLADVKGVDVGVVDEVQGDEGKGFWQILMDESIQQVIATFRGKANPMRLHNAFSMGIRKSHHQLPQDDINQMLLKRFPFVLGLDQPSGASHPRIEFLGQWQFRDGEFQLEPLVEWQDDALVRTTNDAILPLD